MKWLHTSWAPPSPLCYPNPQKVPLCIRAEASQHNAQPQSFGSALKLAAVGLAAAALLHGVAPAEAGVILTKREVKKVRLRIMSHPLTPGSVPRDSRLTMSGRALLDSTMCCQYPQHDCMLLE